MDADQHPPERDGEEQRAGDPGEVTRLLRAWRAGDDGARESLIRVLYDELHTIADARMRKEAPGHTLQSTALIHEAYLRLADASVSWSDRTHFLAVAARTMRRVLTDHARARRREKRSGALDRITLSGLPQPDSGEDPIDLLALDAALEELADVDPRKASAVELHYYGGLTHDEVAEALGVSPATVDRDLRMARAWLRDRLG
jgi:RNA polymerase sigma factor (TIGR02999 family)